MALRERVREIFKKYGVTVVGLFLVAGAVIGVVVGVLTKRLGEVASVVRDGLKAIGKKIGEMLPGALWAIASFLLRTVGKAVGLLAKNAWLLIVAVVVFMIDQVKNKKA